MRIIVDRWRPRFEGRNGFGISWQTGLMFIHMSRTWYGALEEAAMAGGDVLKFPILERPGERGRPDVYRTDCRERATCV